MTANGHTPLTWATVKGLDDRSYVDIEIPEWGGTVRLRAMSGSDRDVYEDEVRRLQQSKTVQGVMAMLIAKCWVNGDGTPAEVDWRDLNAKRSGAITRLFTAASKLNGFSEQDAEALAKN